MSKKQSRQTIELERKRIPLRSLMNGKEIREAAKAIEDFRLKLNDKEILYGAKISIQWDNYDSVYAVARRLETDTEFADRLERQRIAEEQKRERDRKRKEVLAAKKAHEEATRKERVAEQIRRMVKDNSMTSEDLKKLFDTV